MGGIETAEALGGAAVLGVDVESEIDFVHLVQQGLPTSAVDRLVELGEPFQLDPRLLANPTPQ